MAAASGGAGRRCRATPQRRAVMREEAIARDPQDSCRNDDVRPNAIRSSFFVLEPSVDVVSCLDVVSSFFFLLSSINKRKCLVSSVRTHRSDRTHQPHSKCQQEPKALLQLHHTNGARAATDPAGARTTCCRPMSSSSPAAFPQASASSRPSSPLCSPSPPCPHARPPPRRSFTLPAPAPST